MTPVIPLTRPPVRLVASGTFPLPGMPGCTYTIGREAVLDYDLGRLPGVIGVDTEGAGATGRKKYDLKSVQFGDTRHAVLADPRDPAQFQVIRRVLNSGRTLVIHNTPHDVPILNLVGLLDLDSVWNVEDTIIWCRGAKPSEFGGNDLGTATARYLGMSNTDPLPGLLKTLGISKDVWFESTDLNTPAYRHMAATDPIVTARLRDVVRQAHYDRLTKHPFGNRGVTGEEAWRLVEREQIQNRIHLRRQCRGFLVDPDHLDRWRADTGRELDKMAHEIEAAGVTPGDSASLVRMLDNGGHLPASHPRTDKTGQPSGAKKNLAKLTHPLVKTFLQHKELTKLDKDYMAKVMDNADPAGRIHPGTSMLKAVTGRMSVGGDAPLQQFTGAARGILLCDNWEEAERHRTHEIVENGEALPCTCSNPKGWFSIDWSQIEPVVIANVAGDHAALEYYESGRKFYDAITEAAAGRITYKQSKVVLLAQLYGEGMGKLAADLGVSVDEAAELRDAVWAGLPKVKEWAGSWDRDTGRKGKLRKIAEDHALMCSISGRVMPVDAGVKPCFVCKGKQWTGTEDDKTRCWVRKCQDGGGKFYQVAEHTGVNYFVQGSAYDVLAETEIAIHEAGLSDAIYLAMHDELVIDAEARHEIRKLMETPPERLCRWAGRTPVLRTDMAHMAGRWYSV